MGSIGGQDRLSSVQGVRDLIRRHDLDPKKSLGQNYLVTDWPLDRILAAADLTGADTVLEIGPGLGVLTGRLAATAGRVVAIELDDRLIDLLRREFADRPHVEIVHGDILKLDPAGLVVAGRGHEAIVPAYKVVANLPYYITAAVLRHLLEAVPPPSRAVVMVQTEVADRICAQAGQMSLLSIGVQFYAAPRVECRVPAAAFYPQPKVDSAVLCLDVRRHPAVAGTDPRRFFQIAQAGFSQKRKQLVNSLSAGLRTSKEEIRGALETAAIDPTDRAQVLTLDDWSRLYWALTSEDGLSTS